MQINNNKECNENNNPRYNIGTSTLEKWIKVEDGKIIRADKPQEFIPTSHSKEEQLVIREDDIFSDKKKEQFRIFNLVQHTRHLL